MKRHVCAGALAFATAIMGAGCTAPSYDAAVAAIEDGSVLEALGRNESEVVFQAPCVAAIKSQPPARPVSCVYVQTPDTLYFLRYNETTSAYEPAMTQKIAELTAVGLMRDSVLSMGGTQVQVDVNGDVLAFQLKGASSEDRGIMDRVYSSLVDAGVTTFEPDGWVMLVEPVPTTVYIPVYVGG